MSADESQPADVDMWGGMTGPNGEVLDSYAPADVVEQTALIEKARAEMNEPAPSEGLPEDVAKFPTVDWAAAWKVDFTQVDWLTGRFMERGQQVTMVGDGKVGKSLFALDWAIRVAAGKPFLGDDHREPERVLYLDKENSTRDVITRARALGAPPEELENLHYVQFPAFAGALDQSRAAALEMRRLVDYYRPTVIVLDTVSRFIGGKENDSDTWLQLYSLIHEPLKRRGIACLRLDHFGKDSERGSRGSSAKSQDVDHVWELKRAKVNTTLGVNDETIVTEIGMHRTHTRTGLGKDLIPITRRGIRSSDGSWLDNRTRHVISDGAAIQDKASAVESLADRIESLPGYESVPTARDPLRDFMKRNSVMGVSNTEMSGLVAELKKRRAAL